MMIPYFKKLHDKLRRDAKWFMREEIVQDCSDRGRTIELRAANTLMEIRDGSELIGHRWRDPFFSFVW